MPEVPTSNKWLWISGAAVGAYFIYDYFKTQAQPPLSPLGQHLNAQTEGASLVLPAATKTILTTTVHNAIDPTVGTTVTVPVTTTVGTFIKTPVAAGGSSNTPTQTPTTAPFSSNTPIKGTTTYVPVTNTVSPANYQQPPTPNGLTAIQMNPSDNVPRSTFLPQAPVSNHVIDPVASVLQNFTNTPIATPKVDLSSITTGSNYNGQVESVSFDNYGLTSTPDITPTGSIQIGTPYVVNAAASSVQSVAYGTNNYYTGAASDPLCTVYSTTASSVLTGSVQIGMPYVVSTPANDYSTGDQMAVSSYMNPVQSYNYIDTLDTAIQLQSVPQGTVTIGDLSVIDFTSSGSLAYADVNQGYGNQSASY